jgi:nitric oxide dioxygenase
VTPDQKILVKESFGLVAPMADAAAELFYNRLFELDPSLRPMFRGDMQSQGRKLMQTIAVVVRGLDRLETLIPAVEALGRRHVAYGAKAEHYPVVGAALLWTLEKGLGADWTPDVAKAWTAAYATLSEFMIAQAYNRPQAAE